MALYLKYRPLDFDSLVWQDFIKNTLKSAVSEGKTVWAYLFTGPRGTWKTSTARIFAKALNCEKPNNWNPDLSCSICQAFSDESLIDIVEIDAASHTWVDNIREIIEKAQYRPTQAKYKVYIIDEVHMLSKWAFNALLKILEEPPEHVKFILATTEIHKVPETILSRCQRYDFKNFSDDEIISRLQFIAESEGIKVDSESYAYIVKGAEWGMRNAVSLFEQLISDNEISFAHIVETLWVADQDEKTIFLDKLVSQDITIQDDFELLVKNWKNIKNFLKEILSLLQEKSIKLLKNGDDIAKYIELMDILHDTMMKSKNSFDEILTFRIGILKALTWYTPTASSQQNKASPVISTIKPNIEPRKVVSQSDKQEESIVAMAEDIFSASANTEASPLKDLAKPSSTSSWSFDVDSLIAAARKKWAKAALSMTLKWSNFDLQWDVLSISTKTKIALATLEKVENRDVLMLALSDLGMEVADIIVT